MVRPRCSRRRNSGQFAQSPTRLLLAMITRGAHSWVRITPTGRPDWTSMVSSFSSVVRVRTIASKDFQSRAALPVPPYTTRSSGRSAFSGSRLFISIRSGASVVHDLAVRVVPRGARTGRAPSMANLLVRERTSLMVRVVLRVSSEGAGDGFDGAQRTTLGDEPHGRFDLGCHEPVGTRPRGGLAQCADHLYLIHISEPTRPY